MKILLLGFTKLKFMPYASFYLDQINCIQHDVHIVYWNRDLENENLNKYSNITLHEFRAYMEDGIEKKEKLNYFYKYRKFVLGILKSNKFDLIISLHTLPGLCVFDKLNAKYKHKYILDYRDSTFEGNKFFGYLVKKLALNAKVVFVSSDAFRKFLPQKGVEIITSHNILSDSLNYRNIREDSYIENKAIRISYWGLIRHYKHNLQIIDKLANDPRFELHYYGRAQKLGNKFEEYIKKNKITNVFFHGEYTPEERYNFVRNTDVLHNSFFDSNMLLAMSNKYYDGLIFYIPQICMTGSYMGKRCIEKGTGYELDPNETNFANKLYDYYKSLDWNKFKDNCDNDLEIILKEYDYSTFVIKQILNNQ